MTKQNLTGPNWQRNIISLTKKWILEQNGGRIIKTYLEEQEKNGLIITYAGKHKEKRNIVRTRKKRLKNTDISLPCEPSVRKLCHMLAANEVRDGIVSIGHQINTKVFQNFLLRIT